MSRGPLSLSEADAGVQSLLTSEAPTYGVTDHGVSTSDVGHVGKLTCDVHLPGLFMESHQVHIV